MRPAIVIEDADEHQRRLREDEEEGAPDQETRWETEDRASLGPWGARAHRLARRERERRAKGDQKEELL
jgi:hypothetical protein